MISLNRITAKVANLQLKTSYLIDCSEQESDNIY
jgi:hypothetical protein